MECEDCKALLSEKRAEDWLICSTCFEQNRLPKWLAETKSDTQVSNENSKL